MSFTQEEVRKLFDYDAETGALTWREGGKGRKIWKPAGTLTKNGINVKVGAKLIFAHRIIWIWWHGDDGLPEGKQIAHKDGDKTNNTLANLYIRGTGTPTVRKRYVPKSGDISGVRPQVGRHGTTYKVTISIYDRHTIHIGTFKTSEFAVKARRAAEEQRYKIRQSDSLGAEGAADKLREYCLKINMKYQQEEEHYMGRPENTTEGRDDLARAALHMPSRKEVMQEQKDAAEAEARRDIEDANRREGIRARAERVKKVRDTFGGELS
jgi:hypothetical protein